MTDDMREGFHKIIEGNKLIQAGLEQALEAAFDTDDAIEKLTEEITDLKEHSVTVESMVLKLSEEVRELRDKK